MQRILYSEILRKKYKKNVQFQWKTTTEVQVLRKHITTWPDWNINGTKRQIFWGLETTFWGQIQEPGIKQKCFSLQLKMMLQEAYFEIFPRSDTRACPQRLASNRMDWPMQKTFPRIYICKESSTQKTNLNKLN